MTREILQHKDEQHDITDKKSLVEFGAEMSDVELVAGLLFSAFISFATAIVSYLKHVSIDLTLVFVLLGFYGGLALFGILMMWSHKYDQEHRL